MTKDEALRLAFEALAYINEGANNQGPHTGISWRCAANKASEALNAIKAALEAKDEPKDGGWTHERIAGMERLKAQQDSRFEPQRTWVGLTDEEIWETISRIGTSDSDVNPYAKLADARAIEAKLKEKNT